MMRRRSSPGRHIDPDSAEGRRSIQRALDHRKAIPDINREVQLILVKKSQEANQNSGQDRKESTQQTEKKAYDLDTIVDFDRWQAIFFIVRGLYRLTQKGENDLTEGEKLRQYLEFAEHYSAREREERIERTYGLSKKERRELAKQIAVRMIDEGKAEELHDKGYAIPSKSRFREMAIRAEVIRRFVRSRDPRDIEEWDFTSHRLGGMLQMYYRDSPYLAFIGAGIAHPFEDILVQSEKGIFDSEKMFPWEMKRSPRVLVDLQMRAAATRWLLWKSGKDPRNLHDKDFESHDLITILNHNKGSIYGCLLEAGRAYSPDEIREHSLASTFGTKKVYPWEMDNSPHLFDDPTIRVASVKWLIWKKRQEGKDIRQLEQNDFIENKLNGLLCGYYGGSVYHALSEAAAAYSLREIKDQSDTIEFGSDKIYPWELKKAPCIYDDLDVRVAATRWLLWKTGKDPLNLTADDFEQNGLRGMMPYCRSIRETLAEAGYFT